MTIDAENQCASSADGPPMVDRGSHLLSVSVTENDDRHAA